MHDDTPHDTPTRRRFLEQTFAGLGVGLIACTGRAQQSRVVAPGTGYQASENLPEGPVGRPEPEHDQEQPQDASEQLGWAVAGLGHFAQNYAIPGIARARRAKLTGLVSGNATKAQRVARSYGLGNDAIYDYGTMDRLADDDDVDVVYVITPNSVHPELVVKAFEAGKHVMCEKPMANSPAECQRMIDAARAAGRKLMVAYRAHFEPHNVAAKRLFDAGELGDVWFAMSDHHRPLNPDHERDQWRMQKPIAGGGSLVDIGIYALNGIIWLFGETPSRILASIHSPPGDVRFTEVEAFSRVQLEFPSGRAAALTSGYTGSKKRIDLVGSKGTATLDPATEYRGDRLVVHTPEGADEVHPDKESDAQFTDEIDHLCQAIQEGTEIRTPGEMGLRDVRLIEAIYRSAELGRWVDVAPDGSLRDA